MVTIQTKGRVGADGLLRLEVPCPQPGREVQVVLVIDALPAVPGTPLDGIEIPEPGSWNDRPPIRVRFTDGISASDELVRDRR